MLRTALVALVSLLGFPAMACAYGDGFTYPSSVPAAPVPDILGPCFTCPMYESPHATTYVTADFIGFRRDWDPSLTMATLDDPGNIVLSTHSLESVFQPGLRMLVGRRLNDWLAAEVSFLGLLQWDEIAAVQNQTENTFGTAGNLFSPFTNFGDPAEVGYDYNYLASIRVQSSMNNAELNLRQRLETFAPCCEATWVYGLRYINVRDQFQYETQSLEPTADGTLNSANVLARNSLIGLQTGGSLDIHLERRAWLQFEMKFLLMYNDASQETEFTTGPLAGPATTVTGTRSQNRVSVGGDAAVTLTWKVTPGINLRAGYQVIFVDGLALGADNFIENIPFITTDPGVLSQDSHLAWHGPFGGVTATW